MKGNLSGLLSDWRKDMSLVSRLRLAKDIGLGLAYLHHLDNMIIHRDIVRSFCLVCTYSKAHRTLEAAKLLD